MVVAMPQRNDDTNNLWHTRSALLRRRRCTF
jgi:hypothetical protein